MEAHGDLIAKFVCLTEEPQKLLVVKFLNIMVTCLIQKSVCVLLLRGTDT